MEEVKRTFKAIHSMISIYGEQDRLEHIDILLSFFTPYPRTRLYETYPRTRLYETALRHGLVRLTTLEEWGDFDQFDFKAPWMPRNSMIWCWN